MAQASLCEEDTEALIMYCTSFQSQGYEEAAERAKDSLLQYADTWSKASPPRVMDLRDLAWRSAAAGLKDVAAHTSSAIRRATGRKRMHEPDSSHDLNKNPDCVLRRFLSRIFHFKGKEKACFRGAKSASKKRMAQVPRSRQRTALESTIQDLVQKDFQCWGICADSLPDSVPQSLEVRSVVHIENKTAYSRFTARRQAISSDLSFKCSAEMYDVRTAAVTPELNEYWLWHGTTPGKAACIISKGFDLSLAGESAGSLFGRGLCFAESTMKADFYAKESDESGFRVLLLCRVVLGRILYCDDACPDAEVLEGKCAKGGSFHSVFGDREKAVGTFREFVVFDENQVYPEYMVWYSRTELA